MPLRSSFPLRSPSARRADRPSDARACVCRLLRAGTTRVVGRRRSSAGVRAARAGVGAAVLCVLSACAPQAPDHSSWRDQAHLSVQDVASNVSTMSLVLRLVRDGRMFGKYQQIVALNSETNAGRTTDHLSGEQPEPRDDPMYRRVTTTLSDA